MSFSKTAKSSRNSHSSNFHKRKSVENSLISINATATTIVPVSTSMPGPIIALHSNGLSGSFHPKSSVVVPTSTPVARGQTISLQTPPPPYTPVLMSVPPPPIRPLGVHHASFSSALPVPISSPSTLANGTTLSHGVHIHHGQLVQDPNLISSNCVERHQAYYSAISHHHHQIVNGSARVTEMSNSPTVSIASLNQDPVLNDPPVSLQEISQKEEKDLQGQPTKTKTPMCLINELARHNKVVHQYRLTDESGPSHKKTFTVCLKLGDTESYLATGPSIKKAQHAAAAIALEKTNLKHPVPRHKTNTKQVPLTPTVELNTLAMKRGITTTYHFVDSKVDSSQSQTPALNGKATHKRYQNVPNGTQQIYCVRLKLDEREFFGEGITTQGAKHNAAFNALKYLKSLPTSSSSTQPRATPGLNPKSTPFIPASMKHLQDQNQTESTVSVEDNSSDMVKSPISQVHESALKRNMVAQFDVTKETGPPHMRKFITRCRCGDFVTEGEGNGKKASKKRAAELMLENLRQLPPLISCQVPEASGKGSKCGKNKKAEMKKKKAKNLIKLEQKAAQDYGQSINPISRLIQIQQARKEKEPTYTLVAEKGAPRRREFVMQVTVGSSQAKGIGPNKKLAKRAAAEALLQEMGYTPKLPGMTGGQPAKPVLKPVGEKAQTNQLEPTVVKKLTFSDESKTSSKKSLASTDELPITNSEVQAQVSEEINFKPDSPESVKSLLSPITQLQSLAEALNIQLSFRHIKQKDKNDQFISLVKLTTIPPKVFYGAGTSWEESEVDAASKALLSIADSGLEDIE